MALGDKTNETTKMIITIYPNNNPETNINQSFTYINPDVTDQKFANISGLIYNRVMDIIYHNHKATYRQNQYDIALN